jgi:hypothetical protein
MVGFLWATSALASPTMNPAQILDVHISDKGMTRISVENQKIQDVFAHPANLQNNLTLHKSGHVFITPDGLVDSVYLTVITDQGETQDLKLSLKNKKPEPLILKESKKVSKTASNRDISQIVAVFVSGDIPVGFERQHFLPESREGKGVVYSLQSVWGDGAYKVYRFYGSNPTDTAITLNQEEISLFGDMAVVFDKRTLAPGEHCHLFVLKKERT